MWAGLEAVCRRLLHRDKSVASGLACEACRDFGKPKNQERNTL